MQSKLIPVALFLCFFVFSSSNTVHQLEHENISNDKTCQSPVCYDFAQELEGDMDTSVDPCDNFYNFVCGGYRERYKGENITRRKISSAKEVVKSRVEDLLKFDYGSNPPMMREAVTFYKQCNAFDSNKNSSWKVVFEYFKEAKRQHFGLWPIVTPKWNESEFDLTNALIHLKSTYNVDALYKVAKSESLTGSETNRPIWISVPFVNTAGAGKYPLKPFVQLPFGDQPKETSLVEVIDKFSASYNMTLDAGQVQKDIIQLTEFTEKFHSLRSVNYDQETYTLAEVQSMSKQINWTNYFKKIFGNQDIDKNQIVYASKQFLQKTERLLDETPKRVIANFVYWQFVAKFIPLIGNCSDRTVQTFLHSIGAAYIDKFLEPSMLDQVESDLRAIRSAFKGLLKSAPWLDQETRERALQKLELMKGFIVIPNLYRDRKKISNLYERLIISDGNGLVAYLTNLDAILKYNSYSDPPNEVFRDPTSILSTGVLLTNAMYLPYDNAIAVFAGTLLRPFYHPKFPPAVNFGAIGYILGHELSHGFDSTGRRFDENGKVKNWWSNYSNTEFNKRYDCFVQSYAKFAPNGTNGTAYGIQTAAENIADSGGLREAYEALKTLLSSKCSAHQRLPGSMRKYTPEQLYFISFGNAFCDHMTVKDVQEQLKMDSHSTGPIRVIGTAMNTLDFSKAFKCPAGSKMNPTKKCSLFE